MNGSSIVRVDAANMYIYINPAMQSVKHVQQLIQFRLMSTLTMVQPVSIPISTPS
jgi:hypothetical protein